MAKQNIKPDKRNYRKHSTENQEMIKNSLLDNGAGRSILLDNENEIIAGNETFNQAQQLGIPVKIIETDGKELIALKRTDLSTDDEARKQLAIVDNLASDKSAFDFGLLTEDFEIDFLKDVGFDDFDLGIGEAKEPEIDPNIIQEKYETYLNNNIKQIVLYFEEKEYGAILEKLHKIAEKHELSDNSSVVVKLLELYENSENEK